MGSMFQDSLGIAVHLMATAVAACICWVLVVVYAAFFGSVDTGTMGAVQSVPAGVWLSALVVGVAGYWMALETANAEGVYSRHK